MNRRMAVLGLFALLVLAGCTGGVVSDQALNESATYQWNTTATVTATVSGGSYQAVYRLDNTSDVELFHRGDLGDEQPLPIRAIKYRYPNGTVVNASSMDVQETDRRTIVSFPQPNGQFAYTTGAQTGDVFVPAQTNGSYEVVLPPDARVAVPIISAVEPGGYDETIRDNQVHLRWQAPSDDAINVSYYFQRDLYLFGGLIGILAVIAIAGVVYFRHKIGSLAADREADELDVEQ